ncbi:unnamed protein product [Amoebophrya sp. A120]|nr:unnamed protein product [Amoebophrya sp. A120]|eukprot:GSA120T00023237001.1
MENENTAGKTRRASLWPSATHQRRNCRRGCSPGRDVAKTSDLADAKRAKRAKNSRSAPPNSSASSASASVGPSGLVTEILASPVKQRKTPEPPPVACGAHAPRLFRPGDFGATARRCRDPLGSLGAAGCAAPPQREFWAKLKPPELADAAELGEQLTAWRTLGGTCAS